MGIRNIHIVLISASSFLCIVFGAWGITHEYSLLGYPSLLAAVVLIVYGVQFIKKSKVL